jgi:hypothetical protein
MVSPGTRLTFSEAVSKTPLFLAGAVLSQLRADTPFEGLIKFPGIFCN